MSRAPPAAWVTLDASATAAWLLPDEASAATDALYREAVAVGGRFYDASDLEQAVRSSTRLATRHPVLARAAAGVGVLCLEL